MLIFYKALMPVYIVERTLCNLYCWLLVAGRNSLQNLECQTSHTSPVLKTELVNRNQTGGQNLLPFKMSDVDNHFFGRLLLLCKVAIPIFQFPVSVKPKICGINQVICLKWWSFLPPELGHLFLHLVCADTCLSQLHPKGG